VYYAKPQRKRDGAGAAAPFVRILCFSSSFFLSLPFAPSHRVFHFDFKYFYVYFSSNPSCIIPPPRRFKVLHSALPSPSCVHEQPEASVRFPQAHFATLLAGPESLLLRQARAWRSKAFDTSPSE